MIVDLKLLDPFVTPTNMMTMMMMMMMILEQKKEEMRSMKTSSFRTRFRTGTWSILILGPGRRCRPGSSSLAKGT